MRVRPRPRKNRCTSPPPGPGTRSRYVRAAGSSRRVSGSVLLPRSPPRRCSLDRRSGSHTCPSTACRPRTHRGTGGRRSSARSRRPSASVVVCRCSIRMYTHSQPPDTCRGSRSPGMRRPACMEGGSRIFPYTVATCIPPAAVSASPRRRARRCTHRPRRGRSARENQDTARPADRCESRRDPRRLRHCTGSELSERELVS